jgi:hypothetical protein
LYSIYPLVTTGGGGGALPLPYGAYCAKAVTLKRVTAAAVSNASAFMAPLLCHDKRKQTSGITLPQVLKRHTEHFN